MALIRPYKKISPQIDASAFIAENAAVIGDVHIGAGSSVWFGCTLRGDVAEIRIGARSNIQDHTIIHESSKPIPTIIGDDVTIGHACLLHACAVGDGAFIGMQACVMDGAVVEAGALLTPGKTVPSGQLWGGSPAKFMRALTDEDREHMCRSSAHYVDLAGDYKV